MKTLLLILSSVIVVSTLDITVEDQLVTYMRRLLQQYFTHKRSVLVLLPSETLDVTRTPLSLQANTNHDHNSQVVNTLLEIIYQEINSSVIIVNPDALEFEEWQSNVEKPNSYIILLNKDNISGTNFYDSVSKLRYLAFNNQAYFLITVLDQVSEAPDVLASIVLKELWHTFNVLYSVIVVPFLNSLPNSSRGLTINTYSWKPQQSPSKCMEFNKVLLAAEWEGKINDSNLEEVNLFENKVPSNFQSCPIKVSCNIRDYIMVLNEKGESVPKYHHPLVLAFEDMASKFNFTFVYIPTPKQDDYVKSIYLSIQDILLKDADLAIGDLPIIETIAPVVDFSAPFYYYHFEWHVPCGAPLSRLGSITRIFSMSVWMVSIISFLAVGIIMPIIVRSSKSDANLESVWYSNTSSSFLSAWAVMLNLSVPQQPRTFKMRLFFLIIICYSYAMNTVFQTYFTSLLVDPGQGSQISNLEELLSSGIDFGYDPFCDLYINSSEDNYIKIRERRIPCVDRNYCLERVDYCNDFAFFDVNLALPIYQVKHKYHRICSMEEGGITMPIIDYARKGSYYLEVINSQITSIYESGISEKYELDYLDLFKISDVGSYWWRRIVNETLAPPESMLDDEYMPFNLTHLQPAFLVYILGVFCSSVSFLVEFGRHYLR